MTELVVLTSRRINELAQQDFMPVLTRLTHSAPANYGQINGTFQSCAGDDQLFPGVYIQNGQTRTYTQPPESEGIIT